jgi:microcystin-dependent protein
MATPFIAEIKTLAFNFAPRNYAVCNGQILSIAQNTALFSLLGTTYGGNGVATFGLPNLQGRAVMSAGQGPGLTNRVLGELGGVTTVTLGANEIPQHTHGVIVSAAANGIADRSNASGNVLAKPVDSTYATGAANTTMNAGSTTSTGTGGAHNNMQPYLTVNFCIALQGIFPSRN